MFRRQTADRIRKLIPQVHANKLFGLSIQPFAGSAFI